MGKETWAQIKGSKNFNVQIYRRSLAVLMGSILLNGIMGALLFYLYLHYPERDYYATSGIIPPIQLQSLPSPNNSAKALLSNDPPTVVEQKLIPQ